MAGAAFAEQRDGGFGNISYSAGCLLRQDNRQPSRCLAAARSDECGQGGNVRSPRSAYCRVAHVGMHAAETWQAVAAAHGLVVGEGRAIVRPPSSQRHIVHGSPKT